MSRHSFLTTLDPAGPDRRLSLFTPVSDFWALTKPEVNLLVLVTTFEGFYLGYGNDGRL